jgi:membrane-associated phospholipid phosphatase
MNAFRCIIRQKTFYFIAFLVALVPALILTGSNGKVNCFLFLNQLHSQWPDILFINLTFLGDGIFSIAVAALILIVLKQRWLSLNIILAYLFSGILVRVLKRLFVAPRPKEIIAASLYKSFIDGITGVGWDSFPSGHTTSVFALATTMALHVNRKRWGLFFLVIALVVGYSRIYPGQHFLQDVIAGAILGAVIGLIVYALFNFRKTTFGAGGSSETTTIEEKYSSTLAG